MLVHRRRSPAMRAMRIDEAKLGVDLLSPPESRVLRRAPSTRQSRIGSMTRNAVVTELPDWTNRAEIKHPSRNKHGDSIVNSGASLPPCASPVGNI